MAALEDFSHLELLNWININVNGRYKSVKDLCSGVAYCQMIAKISPHSIDIKDVKLSAKRRHEYVHNLNLLQAALKDLESNKKIPIETLSLAGFRVNFEFLKWFNSFYESPLLLMLAHQKHVDYVTVIYRKFMQKLQRENRMLRDLLQYNDDNDSGVEDL